VLIRRLQAVAADGDGIKGEIKRPMTILNLSVQRLIGPRHLSSGATVDANSWTREGERSDD